MWDFNTREKMRILLNSEDVYGTTLLVLALDLLGPTCLEWTPPGLKLELEERLGHEIASNNLDKLLAARAILTSDDFYRRLPFFLAYANALAGDGLPADQIVPATSAECAWAVVESALIFPPEKKEEDFSEEIRAYIGYTLREEGYLKAPNILAPLIKIETKIDYNRLKPEDADFFGAAYQSAEQRTEDLEKQMKEQLQELVGQLKSLPLSQGKTDKLPELV